MDGLRTHVAKAIRQHQGHGKGILRQEEIDALTHGRRFLLDAGEKDHADILALLRSELGEQVYCTLRDTSRVEDYYLQCADVAIAAYDEWLSQRTRMDAGEGGA